MYHYVYKIEDPATGEFYFGSRTSLCLPSDDTSYKGSMRTWKPEDTSRLVKTILNESFASRDEANFYEYDIIKLHIKDPLNRNYSLPGPEFHTVGKDCSKDKNGFFGKNHACETKKLQSRSNTGSKNPSYGKKWMHKDGNRKYVNKEDVQIYLDLGWVIGNLASGKQFSEKRIWITNGNENKYVKESELVIPDGWKLGKTYTKEGLEKIRAAAKIQGIKKKHVSNAKILGTIWVYNSEGKNKRINKEDLEDYIQKGYTPGRNFKPWNKR